MRVSWVSIALLVFCSGLPAWADGISLYGAPMTTSEIQAAERGQSYFTQQQALENTMASAAPGSAQYNVAAGQLQNLNNGVKADDLNAYSYSFNGSPNVLSATHTCIGQPGYCSSPPAPEISSGTGCGNLNDMDFSKFNVKTDCSQSDGQDWINQSCQDSQAASVGFAQSMGNAVLGTDSSLSGSGTQAIAGVTTGSQALKASAAVTSQAAGDMSGNLEQLGTPYFRLKNAMMGHQQNLKVAQQKEQEVSQAMSSCTASAGQPAPIPQVCSRIAKTGGGTCQATCGNAQQTLKGIEKEQNDILNKLSVAQTDADRRLQDMGDCVRQKSALAAQNGSSYQSYQSGGGSSVPAGNNNAALLAAGLSTMGNLGSGAAGGNSQGQSQQQAPAAQPARYPASAYPVPQRKPPVPETTGI